MIDISAILVVMGAYAVTVLLSVAAIHLVLKVANLLNNWDNTK